jgi:hypothetical protein
MGRALQFFFIILVLLCSALPARAVEGAALERGAAITDPLALRELDLREHRSDRLDRAGFGLRPLVGPAGSAAAPILNDELFALPSMAPVRRALDGEFERYVARHRASLPGETIGVGTSHDWQMFDRDLLYSRRSRFVLAGIVNRMDRAYVSPETCGEIRLIYRLTRAGDAEAVENAQSPRLPMTLNVVLRAKGEKKLVPGGIAITCKEIAQRWLASAMATDRRRTCDQADVGGRTAQFVEPADVDRIETNLPIAHAPKSGARFPDRLSVEVFRFDPRRACSRRRRWKTRSIAIGFWPTGISRMTSRHGCSIPTFQ